MDQIKIDLKLNISDIEVLDLFIYMEVNPDNVELLFRKILNLNVISFQMTRTLLGGGWLKLLPHRTFIDVLSILEMRFPDLDAIFANKMINLFYTQNIAPITYESLGIEIEILKQRYGDIWQTIKRE